MHSVIYAFINRTSCIDFEPVKYTTYVVIERNGEIFLTATVSIDNKICPNYKQNNKKEEKERAQKGARGHGQNTE